MRRDSDLPRQGICPECGPFALSADISPPLRPRLVGGGVMVVGSKNGFKPENLRGCRTEAFLFQGLAFWGRMMPKVLRNKNNGAAFVSHLGRTAQLV